MNRKPCCALAVPVLATAALAAAANAAESTAGVSVSVSGLGQVTSEPPGISCPGACTARFPAFSTVTLHAQPARGETLLAWGGDCDSPTHSCRLYLDGQKVVQAGFSAGF